jgi:hypothetical protein
MNIRRGLPRPNRLERLERAGQPGHSCPASFIAPELAQPIVEVRVPEVSAPHRIPLRLAAATWIACCPRGLTEDRAFDPAVSALFFQQMFSSRHSRWSATNCRTRHGSSEDGQVAGSPAERHEKARGFDGSCRRAAWARLRCGAREPILLMAHLDVVDHHRLRLLPHTSTTPIPGPSPTTADRNS